MIKKDNVIEIKVPASKEYLGLIRLVIAGLGNNLEFDFEEVEDLKLAVSEACSQILDSKTDLSDFINIKAKVFPKKLMIDIYKKNDKSVKSKTLNKSHQLMEDIRITIIKHLVDKMEYITNKKQILITLIKNHSKSNKEREKVKC